MSEQVPAEQRSFEDPPHVGGLRLGPSLAASLYGLLVISAAFALGAQRFPDALPGWMQRLGPWIFLVFLVSFALYRLVLVRAGKYTAFRAFFQIGLGVVFFTLLLPSAQRTYQPGPADPLAQLFEDSNAHVRAAAAELAGHRADGQRYGRKLVDALQDPDPEVRARAHHSLVTLTGQDLGPPSDDAARRAWQERYP